MRVLAKAIAILLGVLLVLAVGTLLLSELGGEVVELRTFGPDGESETTRLWIVNWDGALWLRAGQPENAWFLRVQQEPEVELVRGDAAERFRAIPYRDAPTRDRVNALMAADYGFADSVIRLLQDETRSVPIRLVPIEDPEPERSDMLRAP